MSISEEEKLIEKLKSIEALFARPSTPGEKDAAGFAMERIKARLKELEKIDKPIEYRFSMLDTWTHRLLVALLRRYGITPYRYHGQRHTTVMVRVPKKFVDDTLWPEFQELKKGEIIKFFNLKDFIKKVSEHLKRFNAEEIILADAPKTFSKFKGLDLKEIAQKLNSTPTETLLKLIKFSEMQAIFFKNLRLDDITTLSAIAWFSKDCFLNIKSWSGFFHFGSLIV